MSDEQIINKYRKEAETQEKMKFLFLRRLKRANDRIRNYKRGMERLRRKLKECRKEHGKFVETTKKLVMNMGGEGAFIP